MSQYEKKSSHQKMINETDKKDADKDHKDVNVNAKKKWKVIETTQDSGFIPTLGVLLWMGWYSVMAYASMYLIVFGTRKEWSITVTSCLISMLLPRDFPGSLGYKVGDWMMIQGAKYFGLKTIIEDEESICEIVDQGKAAIFALEPHDVLPYPVFSFNPALKRLPPKIGQKLHCLTSTVILHTPFVRQIYSWVRCSSVDKETFRQFLSCGESVVFVPGGVREVTLMDPKQPNDVVLYLRRRKGFVKFALETGSPIIPVYAFNVAGSFGCWVTHNKALQQFGRKVGVLPMFFWGRFCIPFFIPNPQKIHVVIGKPIEIPCEGNNVKNESVEKYHSLFLQEMEALFERHKHEEGFGHRKLHIL